MAKSLSQLAAEAKQATQNAATEGKQKRSTGTANLATTAKKKLGSKKPPKT